jgi:hypothetical protein
LDQLSFLKAAYKRKGREFMREPGPFFYYPFGKNPRCYHSGLPLASRKA